MTFTEKSNWVVLVVAIPTLLLYAALVLPQVLGMPLADVSWVQPMLLAIVVFIVANIIGNIVAAISNPREADKSDERDREIDRVGERIGSWLMAAGSMVALVLAMIGVDHFWIAHAIFVGGIAGALLGSVTKIAAYRGSLQGW